MRKVRSEMEIFGVSFLDVISCGFGAIIMLLLLSKNGVVDIPIVDIEDMLSRKISLESLVDIKKAQTEELRQSEQKLLDLSVTLKRRLAGLSTQVKIKEQTISESESRIKSTTSQISAMHSAPEEGASGTVGSVYAAGIPVGARNVVFIIDTSGSMQAHWPKVVRQVELVLSIHPEVSGIQIMSDNGEYLLKGYKSKWIPDMKSSRKHALSRLRNWKPFSNSSPVEGLEKALKTYAKAGASLSIYILGDDFTGSSYDKVLNTLDRYNLDKVTGRRIASIHAIGFPWGLQDRYSTLMREVTYQNNGVFIAVP